MNKNSRDKKLERRESERGRKRKKTGEIARGILKNDKKEKKKKKKKEKKRGNGGVKGERK